MFKNTKKLDSIAHSFKFELLFYFFFKVNSIYVKSEEKINNGLSSTMFVIKITKLFYDGIMELKPFHFHTKSKKITSS